MVADSSLCSADHVEKLTEGGVKFVARVPETISEAKTRIQEAEIESMGSLTEGYRGEEYRSEYGGVEQRWLVVYSEEAEELLRGYKGRVRVERGFRFLKEPWFMASSIYLQDEKRIMALLMVMTLCLLVYSALEWRIREGLQDSGLAFPDQKGNPTQRPMARWVFQAFHEIHLLLDGDREVVLNMKERHN